MSGVVTIVGYALRESLRRRVFLIVLVLTVAFLALYGLGADQAFEETEDFGAEEGSEFAGPIDAKTLTGATLLGLSMFGTLFLGAVLAVFLTLGVVRGDAERGLLQPLVVRPIGRASLLLARFAAAAGVCTAYVLAVYAGALLLTGWAGGWWPDRIVSPGLELAAAVALIAALSLLGSVVLSATANGIAVFMVFGAGLTAGLLGQIGEGLDSRTLDRIADIGSWALPFEALYQHGLALLTADVVGTTRAIVNLGPFGGAQEAGLVLWPYAVAYVALVVGLAALSFSRRDL